MGFVGEFKKKPGTAPDGTTIYKYEAREDIGIRLPAVYEVYEKEINEHFETLFPGRERYVFHEQISDLVHIDVNIMRPTEEEDYFVVYTTGMSDLPMTLPDEIADHEEWKYAELLLFLPGDWDLGGPGVPPASLSDASFWPIRMLKFVARFPHQYKTWLGYGHTIPNGPQYAPLGDGVGFGAVLLSWINNDLCLLDTRDGRQISFFHVVPAYKQEVEFKLKYGMEALIQRFQDADISTILDVDRPNLCADFTEIMD